ncbi:MAG: hypothetical protein PHU36_02655 [Syntrophomonadaceae bacterium]|nr:hypothetical protein [Syntrophomonadaceae bacterium]
MIHHRLTLFALIFVLTLLPVSSYANEAGVGDNTGIGQLNNTMNMPDHDMSGHTMEIPVSNVTGQAPGAAGTQQTTGNIPNNMDTPAPDGNDMTGHNMGGTGSDTATNQMPSQNNDTLDQNQQANDMTSHDTSAVDMPAEMPGHNMDVMDHGSGTMQDSPDHQAAGTGHGDINPSGKEVNRAILLGGFGLVNGFIVLAAVILKRKNKVGGAV